MDALQDRLFHARATGALFAQSTATPPWGLRLPADGQLAVHAVVQGAAWLWFDDPAHAVELRAGHVALVRGAHSHHLASAPGEQCVDIRSTRAGETGAGLARPRCATSRTGA